MSVKYHVPCVLIICFSRNVLVKKQNKTKQKQNYWLTDPVFFFSSCSKQTFFLDLNSATRLCYKGNWRERAVDLNA